jgi:hypothetical protein
MSEKITTELNIITEQADNLYKKLVKKLKTVQMSHNRPNYLDTNPFFTEEKYNLNLAFMDGKLAVLRLYRCENNNILIIEFLGIDELYNYELDRLVRRLPYFLKNVEADGSKVEIHE